MKYSHNINIHECKNPNHASKDYVHGKNINMNVY